MCLFVFYNFNCVALSHLFYKLIFLCSSGLFPLCRAVSGMYVATRLLRELMLRQGLTLSHMAPQTRQLAEVLPHTWVIETVCGNTNLSPWWRNLCLSTVFYSVSSDDKCNRIKPVKCTGPGWVLNVYLTCGTYSAAWFLGLGTYLFLKAKPLLHWFCVHNSI